MVAARGRNLDASVMTPPGRTLLPWRPGVRRPPLSFAKRGEFFANLRRIAKTEKRHDEGRTTSVPQQSGE